MKRVTTKDRQRKKEKKRKMRTLECQKVVTPSSRNRVWTTLSEL